MCSTVLSLASAAQIPEKRLFSPPQTAQSPSEVRNQPARCARGRIDVLGTCGPNMSWVGDLVGALARGKAVGGVAGKTVSDLSFFWTFRNGFCRLLESFLSPTVRAQKSLGSILFGTS